MIKGYTKNKLVYYKMLSNQAIDIFPGGLGICDMCNRSTFYGYYIPVLNSYYCEECFKSFDKSAKKYEEDSWFENKHIEFFEKRCKELSIKIEEV